MKKMIDKKNLISFSVGMIFMLVIGVSAETLISGNNITYDNSVSNLASTNVQNALDEINIELETGNHFWKKIQNDSELGGRGYNNVDSINSLKNTINSEVTSAASNTTLTNAGELQSSNGTTIKTFTNSYNAGYDAGKSYVVSNPNSSGIKVLSKTFSVSGGAGEDQTIPYSVNVQSIPDYSGLTIDNFAITSTSMSTSGSIYLGSYNASSGILYVYFHTGWYQGMSGSATIKATYLG